jgi:hypothetical protein
MVRRRILLALGVVGLTISAAERVGAGTPAELEGGVYGGSASGRWTCGPSARVNYGGAGARGRVWLSEPQRLQIDEAVRRGTPPVGFHLGGGLAGEYRSYRLIPCNQASCEPQDRQLPPEGMVGALSFTLGYDAPWLGFRAGMLAYQNYNAATDRRPTRILLPDLVFRAGRREKVHGEVGFGSYSIDTMLRPGLYLGAGLPVGESVDLLGRLGVHQVFDDNLGFRGELVARFHLNPSTRLDLGVGSSTGFEERVHPHGRLSLAAGF